MGPAGLLFDLLKRHQVIPLQDVEVASYGGRSQAHVTRYLFNGGTTVPLQKPALSDKVALKPGDKRGLNGKYL